MSMHTHKKSYPTEIKSRKAPKTKVLNRKSHVGVMLLLTMPLLLIVIQKIIGA